MKTHLVPKILFTIAVAAIAFSGASASAAVHHRGGHTVYRAPVRPILPPKPKIITAEGSLRGLDARGGYLSFVDDNTKRQFRLIVTAQTKFTKDGKAIAPAAIPTYANVTVSYQDTDAAVKELKVKSGSAGAAPAKAKSAKKK